ncbi:MAG: hypothetical protein DRN71_03340 [Candidatus Nanohalarchaeota archaeon]|nr:MAG: hypothetical protein DRN71_03340 [Candidatus Nanohaloarchaeota archaeon]
MSPHASQKTQYHKILIDFIFGGLLISIALLISDILGPLISGEFAALPIRVGATIFIAGAAGGETVAYEMSKGALSGLFGAFTFALVLSFTPRKIGITNSFIAALFLCALVICITNPIIMEILP